MEFYLQNQPFFGGIDLFIRAGKNGDKYCSQLVFEPIKEGQLIEHCAVLTMPMAQSLMDQLWNCGVRPAAGQGSAGQLAATERHLADMQKLVFKGK